MTHSTPDITTWSAELDQLHRTISAHFPRSEPRHRACAYLQGLLLPVERKNGWQLAEAIDESTPDGVQRLLNTAKWYANAVRNDLSEYVLHHLDGEGAIGVPDETGFLETGDRSVGVQRQYSGTAGRIENCQIGVCLYHWNPNLQAGAFLDWELYLPKSWISDPARPCEAGIPVDTKLTTKGQLGRALLERALAVGWKPAWVTGDTTYGSDRRLRGRSLGTQ